jgi:hypothetical protein
LVLVGSDILGCGAGYQIKNSDKLREVYTTQAKDIYSSTSNNSNKPDQFKSDDPPEVKYKEAFTDLPFESTVWSTHQDSELNLTIEYPKNTSYRLKPLGSNNLWFIRENGYLMKIDRIDTDQTLEDYVATMKSEVSYKVEAVELNKTSAVLLTLNEELPVRGNIYLVKNGSFIEKIWFKTYLPGEEPDDEQRVQRMLDSLQFTTKTDSKKKSKSE